MSESSRNDTTSFGEQNSKYEEVKIPVPWGHISGKWWGCKNKQPILALHGWQDNAGTFDSLAPILQQSLPVLCIDLPGHGCSSRLPSGSFYYIFWDGLILVRRIVKHFKWDKITIIGHSLGGAIGFLYAASFPDEVEMLISLDIASPTNRNVSTMVKTTKDDIDRFFKYEQLKFDSVPSYGYDQMIDIVLDAYNGSITRKSAEILMRRGMQPAEVPGKYYFSRDPRLKSSMLGMLSLDLTSEYARQIKCDYLNIRAVPGHKFDQPEHYQQMMNLIKKNARRFEYHEVPGSHHVHLNEPEKVSPIILNFLKSGSI
ncbi:probable serine hydrolase isoform X2 [Chelonus insularis]|uniref:probable serine hydrolase isoform X2 n=1 Tax=Chelonus insularis TaxID=460826 RepID=UPI00158B6BEB|nr:probable serine hydrolase isoform X2 [Chelonus insularis]